MIIANWKSNGGIRMIYEWNSDFKNSCPPVDFYVGVAPPVIYMSEISLLEFPLDTPQKKSNNKVWDINNDIISLKTNGKKTRIKTNPLKYLNKLIKNFKIKVPKQLPSMASMLVGYFSYDIIRYIEKIPNTCKDDLKIPDVRLSRPKNLVIYDNLKKKFIILKMFMRIQKLKIIRALTIQFLKNLNYIQILKT